MPAVLRKIMKYRRCDGFVVISSICDCHFRSSDRVTPSRQVLLTCWIGLPLMVSSPCVLETYSQFFRLVVVQRHFVTLLLFGMSCQFRRMKKLPILCNRRHIDISANTVSSAY